jgi:predicted RNA-binding Zn ribbon-like protein
VKLVKQHLDGYFQDMLNPPPDASVPPFLRVGDNPGLDFVNTLLLNDEGVPVEFLDSPAALTAWGAVSGLFDETSLRRMTAAWSAPKAGAAALDRSRILRKQLKGVFDRVVSGKTYAQNAATVLGPYLTNMPRRRLAMVEKGRLQTSWCTDDSVNPDDEFLGMIAGSALDLLVTANPEHLRKCANPCCVVIFHDTTKNHRRQWCSMEACGNRAKARRFRTKHQ